MSFGNNVIYHIYPLGMCGAPAKNDGVCIPRIKRVGEWAPYISSLGCSAVYLGPVMESGTHGYDTHDYMRLDCRLGTNGDFEEVCRILHENGLKIILDGVFNHVGRGFFAFRDLCEKKQASQYKDWFCVNFEGNSPYGDGFWYEGWEGHYELVRLNLANPAVCDYLVSCALEWIRSFDIDGLRLDVAYLLREDFLRRLADACRREKDGFFLLGEMIHGDYNRLLSVLDSVTNYECYKGLYSAFNSMNLFEIGHSLNRQYGSEPWCLYRGKHLASFADNHDVTRLASILTRKEHLTPLYGLLFAMPGIPMIYYGSEWGMTGEKKSGDAALRPEIAVPSPTSLTDFIRKAANIRKKEPALSDGDFKIEWMTNRQLAFSRTLENESVLCIVNADESEAAVPGNLAGGELLLGTSNSDFIEPFGVRYTKFKK